MKMPIAYRKKCSKIVLYDRDEFCEQPMNFLASDDLLSFTSKNLRTPN